MNGMVSRPRHGLSLCAGGGGLDLGVMLAEPGFHTRAFVEWEGYPRSVLVAAQRAGYFAHAPIWDDLSSFDTRPFRGAFDNLWQQRLRGALSLLPMASGPWIWRPADGAQGPAQMNFFEGTLP